MRQTNFDLMRIVCMLMIVMLHFCTHGLAVLWGDVFLPSSYSLTNLLNYTSISITVIFTSIAVNCYVLQTGYFTTKPLKFNVRRISLLWVQVAFYSGGVSLIFKLLHQTDISWLQVCLNILPITSNSYWFFTKYIALVFLCPFLAIIPEHLNKRQFQYMLLVLLSMNLSLVYSHGIFPFGTNYSGWDSLLWFICLYFIGNYIRRYNLPNSIERKADLYFVLSIVLIFFMYIILNIIKTKGIFTAEPNHPLYNGILIIPSVLFLTIFKKLAISNVVINKIIIHVAPLSFGVYLLHDNNCIRMWLWHDLLDVQQYLSSTWLCLYILLIPFCIFVVCVLIDFVRNKIFQLIFRDK